MATFVLVHGAWHGAWCWFKLIPLLEQAGHTVVAVDLPSHGIDKTPTHDVSLQVYAECVCGVLDACRDPVILVGHSMGGVVISRSAELRPRKIKTLVYVAAFLLADGQTILGAAPPEAGGPTMADLVITDDGSAAVLKAASIRNLFYADCEDRDVALARTLLVPQAMAVSVTPLATSAKNFGRVPRFYIECTRDNAIPIETQRAMQSKLPCRRVIAMETSHSPFLSSPVELANNLLELLT